MTGAKGGATHLVGALTPRRPQRGLTLRARLLIGLAAVAFIALGVAAIVTFTVNKYLVAQLDERLAAYQGPEHAGDYDPSTLPEYGEPYEDDDDDPASESWEEGWEELSKPRTDTFRGILSESGELTVFYVPSVGDAANTIPLVDPDLLSKTEPTYLTVHSGGSEHTEMRVLAKPIGGGLYDVIALSLDDVESATKRLVAIQAAGIGALLLGLGVVAAWVIRLGISPMRRMVEASARIAKGDLDVRLDGAGGGTESTELAASLNTMIATLTDSIAEKERSEARLRAFVADASHELRTPLTTVLGYAQLFRRGALSRKAEHVDAWNRTEAEATRMRRLVEDMLELARYDAEPQLHIGSHDLMGMVHEIIGDAGRAFPDVSFEAEHSGEGATVLAQVDGDRLRQAVINLVNNAAQHGAAHVWAAVEAAGPNVSVTVRDDGPGMSPEVAARATERFVRGDASRSRSTGGAGLGLAITAAIADVHGGSLSIASVEGKGTTVTLTVPASAPASLPTPDGLA